MCVSGGGKLASPHSLRFLLRSWPKPYPLYVCATHASRPSLATLLSRFVKMSPLFSQFIAQKKAASFRRPLK